LRRTIAAVVPHDVRELILARVAALDPNARTLVEIAAVVELDLSPSLLREVAGTDGGDFGEALEQLLAARLLVEDTDEDSYRFAHSLVQHAVYSSLDVDHRRALHDAIAGIMATRTTTGSMHDVVRLAHHAYEALPLGSADRAFTATIAAGDVDFERGAYAEAAQWYERALALTDQAGVDRVDDHVLGTLLLSLGRAYEGDQDYPRAHTTYLDAAARARACTDGLLLAECGIAAAGPWTAAPDDQDAAREVLEEAERLVGVDDARMRIRVLASLATTLYHVDKEHQGTLTLEALELAPECGDVRSLAGSRLARRLWLTHFPEARRERLELAEAALAPFAGDSSNTMSLRVRREMLADLLENGEIRCFDSGLDVYEALASRAASPRDMFWAAALRATQALLRGDLDAAEQLVRGARLRGQHLQMDAAGTEFLQQFALRFMQGRLQEIAGALAAPTEPAAPAFHAGAALTAVAFAETGRVDDGMRTVRWAVGPDGRRLQKNVFWLAGMALFATVVADAGDLELAAVLRRALDPCADHIVVFGAGGVMLGSGHHWLGLLAEVLGDPDAAIGHFEEALRVSEWVGARYWAAQARVDLAATLARTGGPSARPRIDELLASAQAVARTEGYGRILVRAAAV
jgi:tetratricopeptide (TPR) repeat protein